MTVFVFAAAVFGQNTYIPVPSIDIENSPVSINDQLIRSEAGKGFRTYYDLENNTDTDINYLRVWLLVYFKNRSKPVLYQYESTALMR